MSKEFADLPTGRLACPAAVPRLLSSNQGRSPLARAAAEVFFRPHDSCFPGRCSGPSRRPSRRRRSAHTSCAPTRRNGPPHPRPARTFQGQSRRTGSGHRLGRLLPGLDAVRHLQLPARPARYAPRHWPGFRRRRRAEPGPRAQNRRAHEAHRRPPARFAAASRWPIGILAGLGAIALGAFWLATPHQPAHRFPGAAHGLHLRRHLHAAQARHHHGHLHRRISRRHGPHARLDRRPRPHRVAGRRPLRHSLRLAVPSLHGHRLALPRRLRARRHSHVARRAARRMVHRRRSALLRCAHDSRQPRPMAARHGGCRFTPFRPRRWAWSTSPTPSASPASCAQDRKRKPHAGP